MTNTEWRARAACRNSDRELFFLDRDSDLEEPRRLCGICPVQADCLAEAIEIRDVEGFRAGLTGEERHRLLPKRSTRQEVDVDAVLHMHSIGWTSTAIGVAVNVSADLVQHVIRRHRNGKPDDEPMVESFAVVRRRQALACIGYSRQDLAPLLGIAKVTVSNYTVRPRVTRAVFERWRDLYARLSLLPGSNVRAATVAKNHGWAPPWAWPGDSIDDPNALPLLEQEAVA